MFMPGQRGALWNVNTEHAFGWLAGMPDSTCLAFDSTCVYTKKNCWAKTHNPAFTT